MKTWIAGAGADRTVGEAPCKDCPDRHPNCWGECDKYKAWQAARSAFVRGYYAKVHEEHAVEEVRKRGVQRAVRRNGNKVGTKGR